MYKTSDLGPLRGLTGTGDQGKTMDPVERNDMGVLLRLIISRYVYLSTKNQHPVIYVLRISEC